MFNFQNFLLFNCLISTLCFSFLNGKQYELSICAIFHNEDRFLKDWIDFHLLVGVEHFYLYNHQSEDSYQEVLNPYIEQGVVELFDWNLSYHTLAEWNQIQCHAYNHGLIMSRDNSKWVAYLDTDEYLYSPEGKNLPDVLRDYEGYGAVSSNWAFYGTSSIERLDPKFPLIFQLIYRIPFDQDGLHTVKSIVDPEKTHYFINPHFPILLTGYEQVTENKEKFQGSSSPSFSINKLRINHYWTRDEEFYNKEKRPRQNLWKTNSSRIYEAPTIILDMEICRIYLKSLTLH